MNRKTKFMLNGSLLAITSLLLRMTGLGFSAWITQKLGAEGTGLISLVNTVYGFGITVAVSGIFLACMRLCSSSIAKNDINGIAVAITKSFLHAAFFGVTAAVMLYSFAGILGKRFLGDERTVDAIRVLSLALPFISLTTVTDAYFTSVGRVYKSAISDFAEQAFKVAASMILLKTAIPFGLQACIVAVTKGSCIGEIGAFFVSAILYKSDRNAHFKTAHNDTTKRESLLRISLPVAVSTYARSGLVTLEHALIPKGLHKYGKIKADALADYGVVRGMALPIVLFPSTILTAFTGLLVPEFAEDHATEKTSSIKRKTSLSMNLACLFSSFTSSIIYVFGNDLGMAVYKNEKAGCFIRYFAPLIPFMYCDTTADSILKGMDRQLYTMLVNIADAAVSVLMTWFIIPVYGLKGYIFTVFMTEILNFSCSAGKLAKLVRFSFYPLQSCVFPAVCTFSIAFITRQICSRLLLNNAIFRCVIGISATILLSGPICMQIAYPAECGKITEQLLKTKNNGTPCGIPLRRKLKISR